MWMKIVLDISVIKITLQPIIENAIYHGLNRMVDEGEITIRIREDGDDIILSVEDNGIGMTEEQCQEILKKRTRRPYRNRN